MWTWWKHEVSNEHEPPIRRLRWNYPSPGFRVYLKYSVDFIILDSLVSFACTLYVTDSKSHLNWPIKLRVAMATAAILDSIFFNIFSRQQLDDNSITTGTRAFIFFTELGLYYRLCIELRSFVFCKGLLRYDQLTNSIIIMLHVIFILSPFPYLTGYNLPILVQCTACCISIYLVFVPCNNLF